MRMGRIINKGSVVLFMCVGTVMCKHSVPSR